MVAVVRTAVDRLRLDVRACADAHRRAAREQWRKLVPRYLDRHRIGGSLVFADESAHRRRRRGAATGAATASAAQSPSTMAIGQGLWLLGRDSGGGVARDRGSATALVGVRERRGPGRRVSVGVGG